MRKKLVRLLVVFSLGVWIVGAVAAITTQNQPLPAESEKSLWERQGQYLDRMGDKLIDSLLHIK
jgi:hypothetical protein